MEEIKDTESDSNDLVQIFIGENGKKRAQIYFGGNIDSGKVTYEGKEYPGVFSLESLMKRRVTDMTGTMTKRIAGGIINASIIMKKYALP